MVMTRTGQGVLGGVLVGADQQELLRDNLIFPRIVVLITNLTQSTVHSPCHHREIRGSWHAGWC